MISLSNSTVIPESEEEVKKIAKYEAECNWKNYYDDGTRSVAVIKKCIFDGKYAEGMTLLNIKNFIKHTTIESGIRYGQKTHDDGSDITLKNSNGVLISIQVKNANDKYLNIRNKTYAKLLKFNGIIAVYQKSSGKNYLLTRKDLLEAKKSLYDTNCKYVEIIKLKKIFV